MGWLAANWGTLVVLMVVAALVGAVIVSLVRAKRQGKTSCGGNCAGCAGCASRNSCRR